MKVQAWEIAKSQQLANCSTYVWTRDELWRNLVVSSEFWKSELHESCVNVIKQASISFSYESVKRICFLINFKMFNEHRFPAILNTEKHNFMTDVMHFALQFANV